MSDGTPLFVTAATQRSWRQGGPTLVGLHGGPGIDGSQLRYFLEPALAWATVVVPDQRGHGRSGRSSPELWSLQQWSRDVHELIERLGLEDVVLVGTSFGGFVVQQFLIDHPGEVRGSVVVGASPRRSSMHEIVERYRAVGGDEAAEVMHRTMTSQTPQAEAEWARVCGPLSRVRPPDDELRRIQQQRVNTPEVNAHFMRTLETLDLRPGLAAVTEPMLVLVGEKDPLTPPDIAAEIRDHATGAEVTVRIVENAAHQVLWDRPELSLSMIRDFALAVTGCMRIRGASKTSLLGPATEAMRQPAPE